MRTALPIQTLRSIYDRAAGRYDLQHTLATFRTDERCRRRVVELGVRPGDRCVLDAGAGTGLTARLVRQKLAADATLVLVDVSAGMLQRARQRFADSPTGAGIVYVLGDLVFLPLRSACFDAVLSTFSACPLYDPAQGAREMYRALRAGGRLAIAHSAEPRSPWVRWLAQRVEDLVWRLPWLSLGCRAVDVRQVLEGAGATVLTDELRGVPLWPFRILVVEKPAMADAVWKKSRLRHTASETPTPKAGLDTREHRSSRRASCSDANLPGSEPGRCT